MFSPSKYLRKTCFAVSRSPLTPGLPFPSEANGPRIRVPHVSKPPGNPISVRSGCIGCLATTVVRGKRAPDSGSPCLKTRWEPYFGEIWEYRLPSNNAGPRETDAGFEFPMSRNPLGTLFQ